MNNIKNINLQILNFALCVLNNTPSPKKKIDFAVGGQAVIEGVMMRSPNNIVIAVRKANKTIKVKKQKYHTLTQKYAILNIPILRGVINLFEMMFIGTKAINFSASEMTLDQLTPKERLEHSKNQKKLRIFEAFMLIFSFIFAMALTIFLFKFVPLWLTTVIESHFPYIKEHWVFFNLIDGVIKMSMFLTYIFVLSVIPDFRRIFEYHGAEHKSIFAYERGLKLTVPNAKKQTRFHPRCGTSFILIVFAISILVYTFVPRQDTFLENLVLRVGLLPIIAGISYEYLKTSAKYANNFFVRLLVAPGLWFQRITTKEPDNAQLEVGLVSLQHALSAEKLG